MDIPAGWNEVGADNRDIPEGWNEVGAADPAAPAAPVRDIAQPDLESMYKDRPAYEQREPFSIGETIKNIPGSAVQLLTDMTAPIHSPVETGKGVYEIFKGIKNKVQGKESPVLDAMGDYYSDRYGGLKNIEKSIQSDPMGMLSDAAGVASLGSSIAAKMPGTVGKAGKVLENTAKAIDPVNAITRVPATVAAEAAAATMRAPMFKDTPRDMIKSASKFSTVLDKNSPLSNPQMKRNQIADTMIKHQIMPTERGQLKAGEVVFQLNDDLDNIISAAEASGSRLDIDPLIKAADSLKAEAANTSLSKPKVIQGVVDDFVKARGDLVDMSPAEMQKYKRELYDDINWNEANLQGSQTGNLTKKAMAKAAKEQVETLDPKIKPINREMGDLLQLAKPLAQSAGRIENRDMIGIGVPIKTMALESVMPGSGALGLLQGITDSPKIKARTGLKLGKLQNDSLMKTAGDTLTKTPQWLNVVKHGLMETGRVTDDEELKEAIKSLMEEATIDPSNRP